MKTSVFAAALALACGAAQAQGPGEMSGSFRVDVEISRRAQDDYLAQFRIVDAVSKEIVAEPAIAFQGSSPADFAIEASPGKACAAANVPGYCIDLAIGKGTAYEAFIPRQGAVEVRKREAIKVAG